jgi:hypothetical protein
MKFNLDDIFGIAFWMVLGGVILWGYGAVTDKKAVSANPPAATTKQRKLAVANTVRSGPKTEIWSTPHGDVIKLDVPYATVGGLLVEIKHCILWRDMLTKTSSMHCEQNQLDTRDYPSDPPDYSDLR